MLIDTGLIGDQSDSPATNETDAVGHQHGNSGTNARRGRRADGNRSAAGESRRTHEDTGAKMHRSTHWLCGMGMCLIGCANAQTRPEMTSAVQPGPAASGTAVRLRDTIRTVLSQALSDSAFPGAIAVVGNRRGELAEV